MKLEYQKEYKIHISFGKTINVYIIGKRKTFFGEKIYWEENASCFGARGCYSKRKFIKRILETK